MYTHVIESMKPPFNHGLSDEKPNHTSDIRAEFVSTVTLKIYQTQIDHRFAGRRARNASTRPDHARYHTGP